MLVTVGLLQPNGIAATNSATPQYRGIDPNISPVVLRSTSQNTRVFRKIALRKCSHHAARAGAGDTQANTIPDRDGLPDPSILCEIPLRVCGLHYEIWAKPSNLEPPLRIKSA